MPTRLLPPVTLPILALAALPTPDLTAQARPATRIDPDTMPRPTLEARRAAGPITLDGTLNELAWSLADSTRGTFYQSIPDQGAPATERTVVRVLYDDERLYVGAVMYDSRPDLLVSAGMEQDFATQDSDIFGFALDTYLDRQNAFLFAVNPAGALFDAQAFNDQQSVNRAWEGEVEVSTRITDEGWVAEVAVPLTTLRFRATEGAQSWGLNFARRIRRISEDSQWAPLTRQFRIYKMSRAGTLSSLEGLRQGRNLWVKPFVNGVRTDGAQAASPGEAVEGGFDLKWGITPQFTLDFTALTDFSQVEVDEQQINLTRFSLFFPEKRDFFLENEGIFAFQDARVRNFRTGSGPQNFKLFHSRRIGLSAERTPVPIAGGVRLTGRAGGYAVGLLNMQTRDKGGSPAENSSVVRLRKNVLGSSDIGVMFVNRAGTGPEVAGDYNRSFGADANQPDIPRVRELNPYVDIDLYSDLEWALETREITPGLGVSFLDSGILTLEYAVSYERLAAETRIAGASVPAGEYDFGAFTASYQSNLGRKVGGRVSVTQGGFFDGERTSLGGSVTLRPSARLFVEGTAQRNRLTLAGRTFEANLFGGRVRLARDTRTFLSAFVQYNESADELQTNIRFNLVHAPLSDLFLVYSERRNPAPEAGEAGLIDRAITVKFTKLLAF
ncbi:MAG: DUF5916 domain-containing protein [Gemmatimonadota bacterium]|nr:DUF5916 domain-containing protein [Gemmatimonadota bacterium]